jgi:hypothetical protein
LDRFVGLDARPVNLDGFAERDEEAGLVAAAPDFDLIDAFIAAHGNPQLGENLRRAAGAPLCAALMREAAGVHARRGLLKSS